MANAPYPYVYGYKGPPFNWLGHFSLTQWQTFQAWYNGTLQGSSEAPSGNFPGIELHHRIRAQQLRKTAGAQEEFFYTVKDEAQLAPTFMKAAWQPPQGGWFPYIRRDDHLPMVAMSSIKTYLQDQLQRQDDSVFHMNHLRNIIEKTEDKAQNALNAVTDLPALITQINGYFALPQYAPVLVNDQNDVYPSGATTPRYRVQELDAPTIFEQEQVARVTPGGAVALKEETQPQS